VPTEDKKGENTMTKTKKALLAAAIALALLLLAGIYLLTGEVRVLGPLGHIDLERSLYPYDQATGEVGEPSTLRLSGWFCTLRQSTGGNECHLDPLEVEALPGFRSELSTASVEGPFVTMSLMRYLYEVGDDGIDVAGFESMDFRYDRSTGLVWLGLTTEEDTLYLMEAPSPEEVPEIYKDFHTRYLDALR